MPRLTAAGRLADPQRTELAHSLELLRAFPHLRHPGPGRRKSASSSGSEAGRAARDQRAAQVSHIFGPMTNPGGAGLAPPDGPGNAGGVRTVWVGPDGRGRRVHLAPTNARSVPPARPPWAGCAPIAAANSCRVRDGSTRTPLVSGSAVRSRVTHTRGVFHHGSPSLLPVLVATAAIFIAGWLWYSPLLFYKPWMRSAAWTPRPRCRPRCPRARWWPSWSGAS